MMSNALATNVFASQEEASAAAAAEIAALMRSRAPGERPVVLGLATGGTPVLLYRELVRLHREEGLSFAHVVTFNLDEYLGLERDHPESYWTFMHRHLFDHVDIPATSIHLPDGTASDLHATCTEYETAIREAGGIDLQVLGIGLNGHIGFNEPGSAADTRTRVVDLNEVTTRRAAPDFGGEEHVPKQAVTMGVGTILDARRVILLAFGDAKREIVQRALTDPVSAALPATYLQDHPDAAFFLDRAAAPKV